jgi:serine/threonine protein kinase
MLPPSVLVASAVAVDRRRVKALFFDASDLPPAQRRAFVEREAAGDGELLEAVMGLLEHHDDAPLIAGEARPQARSVVPDPLGLVGECLDERYLIEASVAEGGFAFVYRARDEVEGKAVAIKVFKEVDEQERERIEAAIRRERDLLVGLASKVPVVVESYGLGRFSGPRGVELTYLVLEWLDGEVLRVDSAGMSVEAAAHLLAPIVQGLVSIHEAGVAHRDIKPDNIFVTRDGAVRLLDFGIAKVASERKRGFASTATASSGFTVNYAAPEQLANAATGPWTDVYALGVLLVELIAGRHPYAELGFLEAMLALANPARCPSPKSVGVELSDELEALFLRVLSVDVDARPSLAEFWDQLSSAID